MGLLSKTLKQFRSNAEPSGFLNPQAWFIDLMGGSRKNDAGVEINDTSALSQAAVFACIQVICDSIAVPPIDILRLNRSGSKEVDYDHRLYEKLHYQPDTNNNSFEWRHLLQGHYELRGNAYACIAANSDLIPIHPDHIKIRLDSRGRKVFDYQRPGMSSPDRIEHDEMLHFRGFSADGYYGMSPLRTCLNAVGLSIATEKHGARLFSQAARPDGYLKHPKSLKAGTADKLRDEIREKFSGNDKSHGLAMLEEDIQWVNMGLKNDEAQFLETRKFQRSEICSFFRVPPHLIGDLERSTNNNIEQQSIDFVKHCLLSRIKRWEMVLNLTLLTEKERKKYQLRFNLDAFLRGDSETRARVYSQGRQWGWLSADDVRELEDMPHLPDGKGQVYLEPQNMQPAGTADDQGANNGTATTPPPAKPADPTQVPATPKKKEKSKRSLVVLLENSIERALTKEKIAQQNAQKKDADKRAAWSQEFYPKLKDDLRSNVAPVLVALKDIEDISISEEAATLWAVDYCEERMKEGVMQSVVDISLEASKLAAKLLEKAS